MEVKPWAESVEALDTLIDAFNWEKWHRAMVGMHWGYGYPDKHIPSIAEGQELVRYLFSKEIVVGTTSSTGGFYASRLDDGNIMFEFVLDSVSSDDMPYAEYCAENRKKAIAAQSTATQENP